MPSDEINGGPDITDLLEPESALHRGLDLRVQAFFRPIRHRSYEIVGDFLPAAIDPSGRP